MIYQVNNLQYRCRTGSHKEGFTHKVDICDGAGVKLLSSTTKYYNRTWEVYQYQSAMQQAQKKLARQYKKLTGLDYKCYDFENKPKIISWN